MYKMCGMCVYYKGYCSNGKSICVNGSEYIDKRETISANVAIDDTNNSVHIVIEGDLVKDYETFGKDLFESVQTFIRNAMKRGDYQ